jgi:hypothetical protein
VHGRSLSLGSKVLSGAGELNAGTSVAPHSSPDRATPAN